MASTIARNEPESSGRGSDVQHLAADGQHERAARPAQWLPVLGTSSSAAAAAISGGEDRAVAGDMRLTSGLTLVPGSRTARRRILSRCALVRPTRRLQSRRAEASRTPARPAFRAAAGLLHGQRPGRHARRRGPGPPRLRSARRRRSRRPGSSWSRSSFRRCSRPALTARLDQLDLRRTLPSLYVARGAGLRGTRLPGRRGPFLLPAGPRARRSRRHPGDHRPRPHARRGRRRSCSRTGCSPRATR